jgi:hypothetical protein
VQAYAYTKYLGHLNLTFDDNGELLEFEGQPILLDGSKRQGICKKIHYYARNSLEMNGPVHQISLYEVCSCVPWDWAVWTHHIILT